MEGIEDSTTFYLQDYWISKLLIILVGYGSVVLPFYFLIRFVTRRCKENDLNFRQSPFHKLLRSFAVGHPEYSLQDGLQKTSTSITSTQNNRFFRDCMRISVYFLGIQVTLVCMGFFQERIITRAYPQIANPLLEDKFEDAQFLVFANRLVAFLMAGSYLFYHWRRQPVHIPLYIPIASPPSPTLFLRGVNMRRSSMSLSPHRQCAKPPKSFQPWVEYFMALTLVFGASIFFLSMNSGEEMVARHTSTTISGLLLMLAYLLLDAFTPNYQKKLLDARVTTCQMMFYVNAFSAFLCLASLLEQMTLFSSISFIVTHSSVFRDCFLLSLGSALGQIFIYMTIEEFGPVVLSVMMTLRQIFSIILSSFYFSHPISLLGMLGLSIVFGSILIDTYRKYFCNNNATRKTRK
uniref:Adenosine 3'-phospho 5'-phosphosulfate transporter 1 n=1 Tax=Ditylenchus dipsaci TaxID=166011 RepID=A0A915D1H1_9BILA